MLVPSYVGWILGVLGTLPLVGSSVAKFMRVPAVESNLTRAGFEAKVLRPIGLVELAVAILSLVPATSLFGVILATGWSGGAVATHVRIGEKFLAPIVIATVIWIGFCLRHWDGFLQLFGR